jgi:hypothetical protein
MSSDNNKASIDPLADRLDAAIAALRSTSLAEERPSPALVAATIDALRRLDATLPENPAGQTGSETRPAQRPDVANVELQPALNVAKPSRRIPRVAIWAAALAAAVCVAIVVNRPIDPPEHPLNRDSHSFGPIVLSQLDPQPVYTRMDEQIAQAQSDVATLIDRATRIQAEQQIAQLLADDRELKGTATEN